MTEAIWNYIAGQRQAPRGETRHRVINPARLDDVVAEYELSSVVQTDTAIAAAVEAARAWRLETAIRRGEMLAKAGSYIMDNAGTLGALACREMGKPLAEAVAEANYAGKVLQFYGAEAQRPRGETLNSGRPNVHLYTVREPVGVVGAITPWNFPFSIACWKIGPALVTGNTVVWKPAPHHPLSSQAIMEALEAAGLPEGVVNLVHGGAEVGDRIARDERVGAVAFTGSTMVGEEVFRIASARLARAQCEMGGKNAVYVHRDADIDKAVSLVVEGAFRSAGQKCTATSRVLVDREIEEAFVVKLVARARELTVGNPADARTFVGPVVDERQFTKVRGFIERAVAAGFRIAAGGAEPSMGNGYFVAPTIVLDVAPDAEIARQEVFGPVAAVMPVEDIDEALRLVNDTRYGLSVTICTRDLSAAHRFARDAEAGVVNVNLPTAGVEMHAPFGGWKGSGIGMPEQGLKILDFYTKWRSVAMQFS
ncbi:MAG: aldehyde dehydrogenase family protein [Rhizobiales bacterium]|nr:aldehyde dehydrogenase family protein [Hyphomicrobiales bacterium]